VEKSVESAVSSPAKRPKTIFYSVLHLFLSPVQLLKNAAIFSKGGKNMRREEEDQRRGAETQWGQTSGCVCILESPTSGF
jgi:hypothetical protein